MVFLINEKSFLFIIKKTTIIQKKKIPYNNELIKWLCTNNEKEMPRNIKQSSCLTKILYIAYKTRGTNVIAKISPKAPLMNIFNK